MQDKQKEIRHDESIRENAEFFWGWATPAGRLRAERRACMMIKEIKARDFKKILEIGSGTGIFTEFFCNAGLEVTGIDISQELLKKAEARCNHAKSLELKVADAEDMPFSDNTFDAVVGVCVLHHLNVVPVLKEVKRVVKKGGIMLFSEPNMMNPQLMLQKNVKPIKQLRILGETEDETAFFKWQMRRLLRDIGFREIRVTSFDFLHPWTPEFLVPFVKRLGRCLEKLAVVKEMSGSLFISAVKY